LGVYNNLEMVDSFCKWKDKHSGVGGELHAPTYKFSHTDLDCIVVGDYLKPTVKFYIGEVKMNGGHRSSTQVTAHAILDTACRQISGQEIVVPIWGRCQKIKMEYQGYHLIRFETLNPDEGYIMWDDVEIDKGTLFKLLRMECHPSVN